MTRTGFLIIASAALTGAIPGVAHASCSGSACSAVSAAATWSASDKRVNAVLTNKDQAKELRLKFCINVDGRCENYELTLPPHGTVTKTLNMSMRLGAAPKVAVDVSSADFIASPSASQAPAGAASPPSGTAAAAPSGPVTAVEVRGLGKFTYSSAAESAVGSLAKKAAASFASAEDLDAELHRQDDKLASITRTLESIPDIATDVARNRGKSHSDANTARIAENSFQHIATSLGFMQREADEAVENLAISKDDLVGAQDSKRAEALMVEAAKMHSGLQLILKAIPFAVDTAKKVASGPEGQASLALDAVSKLIETFAANPWEEEAKKLQDEAASLRVDGAVKKLAQAGKHLKSTKQAVAELQSELQDARAIREDTWSTAKQNYDNSTKGHFQWQTLDAAIPGAQNVIELARKTTEAAYGAREAAKALDQTGGGSNWATPAENHRIAAYMADRSKAIFDQSVKTRQEAENLLKNLQTASEKAKREL